MREWMEDFGTHWTIYRCTRTIYEAIKQQGIDHAKYYDEIPDLNGIPFEGGYFIVTADDDKDRKLSVLIQMMSTFIKMVKLSYPDDFTEKLKLFGVSLIQIGDQYENS